MVLWIYLLQSMTSTVSSHGDIIHVDGLYRKGVPLSWNVGIQGVATQQYLIWREAKCGTQRNVPNRL